MDISFYDWFKDGFTSIPNYFFNHYHALDLTSDESILLLYLLSQISQGKLAEDQNLTSKQLNWSNYQVTETLNQLMNKGYLEIELVPNGDGRQTDHYTLRPFIEVIQSQIQKNNQKSDTPTKEVPEEVQEDPTSDLLQAFENEFGRPLSQIELEIINDWLFQRNYPHDLVYLALKQAIIHGAHSFKYVGSILLNWSKKNIWTVEAAQNEIAQFESRNDRKYSINNPTPSESFDIPIDYWKIQD